MNNTKIAIACDHAGYIYKEKIKKIFKKKYNIIFEDYGAYSKDSIDYPDVAHKLANSIEKNITDKGIILCGSGNGVCMTVNKNKYVRAALCWTKEIASLARQHNDANVLCLPARFISIEECIEMVDVFINTVFEGGRHLNRVKKINNIQ